MQKPLTVGGMMNTIVTDKGIFDPKGEYFPIRKLTPGATLDDLKILRAPLNTKE